MLNEQGIIRPFFDRPRPMDPGLETETNKKENLNSINTGISVPDEKNISDTSSAFWKSD